MLGHRTHNTNLNVHIFYSSRPQMAIISKVCGREGGRNKETDKERKKRRGKETGMEGVRKENLKTGSEEQCFIRKYNMQSNKVCIYCSSLSYTPTNTGELWWKGMTHMPYTSAKLSPKWYIHVQSLLVGWDAHVPFNVILHS
jgi:hypothetical protein